VVEQWLRRAATASAEREVDDATESYYRAIRGEDHTEDELLSRSLSDATRRVAYDEESAPRRRQARR
jgi:hypothetical protein